MFQTNFLAILLVALAATASLAAPPVQPREVFQNEPGTKVIFTRVNHKTLAVPQDAADAIIGFANQIKKRDRPVEARPFQEAPLGSFEIGEKTWLHLASQGILEDAAYQGVRNDALKRLAKLIADNYDDVSAELFEQWIDQEKSLKQKEDKPQ